nr:putative nuclease HARBI1 [Ipomoea batatas]
MESSGGDAKDDTLETSISREPSHCLASHGTKFVDGVLKGENEVCLENFRMDKHVFYKLCDMVKTRGLLRHTNRIKIEEQVAIFMFILGRNLRTRAVQELFKYSSKYYLVDGKYANIPGFIAPYPDSSYAFLEFDGGFLHQDAKKLFNHRHSLLRSVTARTFEALKMRFPILMAAPSYPLQTQVKLVVAACAIHNFIREENPEDWIFKIYDQEAGLAQQDPMPPLETEQPIETQVLNIPFETEQLEQVSQLRDSIASEIWNAYLYTNDFPSV